MQNEETELNVEEGIMNEPDWEQDMKMKKCNKIYCTRSNFVVTLRCKWSYLYIVHIVNMYGFLFLLFLFFRLFRVLYSLLPVFVASFSR